MENLSPEWEFFFREKIRTGFVKITVAVRREYLNEMRTH